MKSVNKFFLLILITLSACASLVFSEVIVSPYGASVAVENDEEAVVDVTLTNNGDQDVIFKITYDDPPEEEGRRIGPRRDDVDLEGMMFAVFQDQPAWQWLDDLMMQRDPLLTRNGDDANYDGITTIDLSSLDDTILNGQTGITVTYYETQEDLKPL